MDLREVCRSLTDRRGVALPVALLALLLLTSLTLVLLTLTTNEPVIATNLMRSRQARALAESGLERAIWALNNSSDATNGVRSDLVGAAPAPYDGNTYRTVSGATGEFTVQVTGSATPNVKTVTATGYSPSHTASSKGTGVITATVTKLRNLAFEAPCALCVNTPVAFTGNANASGMNNGSCGAKSGITSSGGITLSGSSTASGSSGVAATSPNQTLNFLLGPSDFDSLRALAKTSGRYIKPAATSQYTLGSVIAGTDTTNGADTTSSNAKIPNGLVFIDTTDGSNTLTASNRASVRLDSGWSASTPFSGVFVVLGDVEIRGNFGGISGVIYVVNNIDTAGMGTSQITGLTVVQAALQNSTNFTPGNSNFVFDCTAAQAVGVVPPGWFVQPGTYCDKPGGCS